MNPQQLESTKQNQKMKYTRANVVNWAHGEAPRSVTAPYDIEEHRRFFAPSPTQKGMFVCHDVAFLHWWFESFGHIVCYNRPDLVAMAAQVKDRALTARPSGTQIESLFTGRTEPILPAPTRRTGKTNIGRLAYVSILASHGQGPPGCELFPLLSRVRWPAAALRPEDPPAQTPQPSKETSGQTRKAQKLQAREAQKRACAGRQRR
jgi:hypothetical protein